MRAWLALALAHLGAALLLALAPAPALAHALVASGGLVLAAAGLAYAFAPAFTRRERLGAWPSWLVAGLVLAGDALFRWPRLHAAALGLAGAVLALHLAAGAWKGPRWSGDVDVLAKDQPFRAGDALALAHAAVGLGYLAVAAVLLSWAPRGLLYPGLLALLLGGVLPLLQGALLFVLPRAAKRRLPGATLVAGALVVHALAVAGLLFAQLRPVGADFRFPAAAVLLALVLPLVALARLGPLSPGPGRALARTAAALAALAGAATWLAFAGGAPGPLFPVAGYAVLALGWALVLAVVALGAPLLGLAAPRPGRWAGIAGALAIAGLFLVAPAFQYARSPFPGVVALLVAAALAARGLAPRR